jgi:hypothetical protein
MDISIRLRDYPIDHQIVRFNLRGETCSFRLTVVSARPDGCIHFAWWKAVSASLAH